jgi:hypothetical protein
MPDTVQYLATGAKARSGTVPLLSAFAVTTLLVVLAAELAPIMFTGLPPDAQFRRRIGIVDMVDATATPAVTRLCVAFSGQTLLRHSVVLLSAGSILGALLARRRALAWGLILLWQSLAVGMTTLLILGVIALTVQI